MKRICLIAALLMLVSCGGNDTEDLIVGTWKLTTVTHQSTGHPNNSFNGTTTESYDSGDKSILLTFGKDGNGSRIETWKIHDSIYIYVPDTTYVDDTFYVTERRRNIRDTLYIVADTTKFSYLATGNLLNIQEGGLHTNHRIDKLDKQELIITDTNSYTDNYTNDYGRSMQFTQETKTVMSYIRR